MLGGQPWQSCHGDLLLLPILSRSRDCSIVCYVAQLNLYRQVAYSLGHICNGTYLHSTSNAVCEVMLAVLNREPWEEHSLKISSKSDAQSLSYKLSKFVMTYPFEEIERSVKCLIKHITKMDFSINDPTTYTCICSIYSIPVFSCFVTLNCAKNSTLALNISKSAYYIYLIFFKLVI